MSRPERVAGTIDATAARIAPTFDHPEAEDFK